MKIFGREPAAITAAITIFFALLSAFFFHFTDDVTGLINACVQAVMAAVVAITVHDGKRITIIVGACKAALSLSIGLGLKWDPMQQATALTAVEVFLSLILRDQVIAPVDSADVTRSPQTVTNIKHAMKRISILLLAALLPLGGLTSCAVDPNASAGQNAATFWNTPQMQDALGKLRDRAFVILTGLISGMGVSPKSMSAQDKTFAKLKAENPGYPDEVLLGAVASAQKRLQ